MEVFNNVLVMTIKLSNVLFFQFDHNGVHLVTLESVLEEELVLP